MRSLCLVLSNTFAIRERNSKHMLPHAAARRDCGLEGRSLGTTVGVSGDNFSLGEKQLVCYRLTAASHEQPPLALFPYCK